MSIPTLREIINGQMNCVIHTPTKEYARQLCSALLVGHDVILTWTQKWDYHKANTVYVVMNGVLRYHGHISSEARPISKNFPLYNVVDVCFNQQKHNVINNMIFTITHGNRRYRDQLIPIVTTTVHDSQTGKSGSATCDESDYNERDGILNAIANMVFGNFDNEYKKTKKAMKHEHEINCTCTICGERFCDPEEARACEQAHIERQKEKRKNYLLRKEAKKRVAEAEREGKIAELMVELMSKKK